MSGDRLKDWMSLARGANLPSVWSNVIAAWAINAGAGPSLRAMPEWTENDFFAWSTFFFLIAGASMIYAGGCFLNDARDHRFDREHRPERPIPSGRIPLGQVVALGIGLMGAGSGLLILGAGCSWKWCLSLVLCILTYDWIHKQASWAILLMGACRSLLWLTAATAAGGMEPAPHLYCWALAAGAYVTGISWYARGESKPKPDGEFRWSDRIPIALLFSPPLLALALLVLWNNLDPIRVFLANCSGLLAGWIVFQALVATNSQGKDSVGQSVSLLLCGICAVDALALCFHAPLLVGPCILLGAFARLAQKRFAAT